MIETWQNERRAARWWNTERPLTRSLDQREEGLAMQATCVCSVTDCDRPRYGRGLCQRHLERQRRADRKAAGAPRCKIEACDEATVSRGWCEGHYRRWVDHGDPLAGRPSPVGGPCSVDGCDRPNAARTWCALHYYRWKRTGEVGPAEPGITPCQLPNSLSPFWQDDQLTYSGAHSRVRAILGAANRNACVDCDRPAAHWSYNHSDPNVMTEPVEEGGKPYSADPAHYRPRCNSCHVRFDNRMRGSMAR
jgi:hypothetical protein